MRSNDDHVAGGATAIGRGAGIVLRGLENRARLAALELAEERGRLRQFATGVGVSVVVVLAAVFAGTFLVAAVFWDTPQRVSALAWLTGLESLGAGATGWWLRHRWRTWQPLAETREQLRRDHDCIRDLFTASHERAGRP